MCRRRIPEVGLAAFLALAFGAAVSAGERTLPVDCLPDEVVAWEVTDPDLRFGAGFLPGIVLGPPGGSLPQQGSTSVASLGDGGSVTLAFHDTIIEDGPGPDFIVFENPFFIGSAPASPGDPFGIFIEPAIVEVSADGTTWHTFPFDADALADAVASSADATLFARLQGLAGITPTFTGSWTVPDDPVSWDPTGAGGVSGAGGDAFDLATVGLTEARFVRLTDAETFNGAPGPAEGFDLDTIVVLHGRPVPPLALDSDGDRLSDLEETELYGSNPFDPDSDNDGLDDGREVASCLDPGGAGSAPAPHLEPRLWLWDDGCTELRWTFQGTGVLYDLVRGDLAGLTVFGGAVDLADAVCLTTDHPTVAWSCDADVPPVSEGWFYLVRAVTAADFGRSSGFHPRQGVACP